jgi:aryl-alcohol dehydrogenase-like predicted oxidoreductase
MNKSSKLILGTVQFGLKYGINNSQGQVAQAEVVNILKSAQNVGLQFLDTAAAYGNAEQRIGEYHRKYNQKFKIITKFQAKSDLSVDKQIENALTNMNKSTLEVVLFHSFNDYRQHPEALEALLRLKKEGKIGQIGVSVYTNDEVEYLLEDQSIEVIQIPFNLLDNETQRGEILRKSKEVGKIIHTRSVFLQGLFFKDVNTLPKVLVPLKDALLELRRFAKDANLTLACLALNYALAQPYIDGVLIGVDNEDQLVDNLKALENPFSEQLTQQINSIKVAERALLNPVNWKS